MGCLLPLQTSFKYRPYATATIGELRRPLPTGYFVTLRDPVYARDRRDARETVLCPHCRKHVNVDLGLSNWTVYYFQS